MTGSKKGIYMFRTPRVGTRVLAGLASFATVTGVMVPLLATPAFAAVTSISVSPTTYQEPQAGAASVTGSVTHVVGELVQFAIVSGPDSDQALNGTNNSDGQCTLTTPLAATTAFTCSVQNLKSGVSTPGTDVVRVYGGIAGSAVVAPSADATVIFNGPASTVDLSPASDSAAAGTCNAFTATITDAGGRVVPNQLVELEASMTGTLTGRSLSFCDPQTTNPTSSDAYGDTTSSADPAFGEVQTDAAPSLGKATFGIRSDQPGGASIRAYVDSNDNGDFNAGEPTDVSTKTFTAGGGDTGNAAQDAVASLTVTPTATNSVVPETVNFTVTTKNSAGDPTPNVTVSGVVSGPNAAAVVSCAPGKTNNSGQTVCSYTTAVAGTDTITFFVNQTCGTLGTLESCEPRVTATNAVAATPVGNTIDLTCVGNFAGGTASPVPVGEEDKTAREETCKDPTTDNNEVFNAFVSKGLDTNGKPLGQAGILVRFTVTSASPGSAGATVTPTEAVTGANGVATTTLTDTVHTNGRVDTVVAVIAGQEAANSDDATKTFETAVPTVLVLSPKLTTNQTGSASTFVANVTDQFNQVVSGANVDFAITGRNVAVNNAGFDKITNASGDATFTYTDTGALAVASDDTITAWADYVTEDDVQAGLEPQDTATNKFITGPATAGSVDLDVKGVGTCGAVADPANDAQTYPPDTSANTVCALVKLANGQPLGGKTVTFTLSGVGSFVSGTTVLTSPQTAVTDSNGVAMVSVKSTQSGAQNLTAAIDGKSDAGVITYTSPLASEARNIDLKPDTSNLVAGPNQELTSRVIDRFGNPVQGITVDFQETGPGRFSNGTSNASGVTGATGTISVTLQSDAGTTGTETVTAAISGGQFWSQCAAAADKAVDYSDGWPGSTVDAPGAPAGNCSDSSTYTFTTTPPTGPVTISGGDLQRPLYGSTFVILGTAPANSTVVLNFHKRGTAGTDYSIVRTVSADASGNWSRGILADTDYRYFANVGTSTSNNVLLQALPTISGPLARVVAKNHTYTITGNAVPGTSVYLHFHRAGTAASDYSIVRSVTANSSGVWTRAYLASVDYRIFVSRAAGDSVTGFTSYLFQAR